MFRRARALMSQGFATMAAADRLMDRGDAMMAKGEAMITITPDKPKLHDPIVATLNSSPSRLQFDETRMMATAD